MLMLAGSFSACSDGNTTDDPSESNAGTELTNQTSSDHSASGEDTIQEETMPDINTPQFFKYAKGFYNYCPSAMQTDENTIYVYYCTNSTAYEVVDYIGLRIGTRESDGTWTWSKEKIVFSPTENTWDAHHTCDPSVAAGEFTYNGEKYSYLMAYLGCTSYDNQDNEIGLAVAKSPEGPFIKVGSEPFINFEFFGSADIWEWGVGQPSIVNLDKKGHILIFYTRGDRNGTRIICEEWDLSDLSNPQKLSSSPVSTKGLTNLNGGGDGMNNADFVYDSENDRFYAVSDCNPMPADEPNYISTHFRVVYFDKPEDYSDFTWSELAVIGENETDYPRNHNAGILRDAYGHLPKGNISVFYTVSKTGPDSLWTYKIHKYILKPAP